MPHAKLIPMKNTAKLLITPFAALTLALTGCAEEDFSDLFNTESTQEENVDPQDSDVVSRDDGETDFSSEFTTEEAQEALTGLERVPFEDDDRYDRVAQFGDWQTDPETGCTTRELILLRDLDGIETGDSDCDVVEGTLDDPYSGEELPHDADIQIDHSSVPLKYAVLVGALDTMSQEERVELANDPANLLAVNGSGNACRGDYALVSTVTESTFETSEAAGCDYRDEDVLDTTEGDLIHVESPWILHDDSEYQCEFTQQFIFVLDKYDLDIIDYDAAAAEDILEAC